MWIWFHGLVSGYPHSVHHRGQASTEALGKLPAEELVKLVPDLQGLAKDGQVSVGMRVLQGQAQRGTQYDTQPVLTWHAVWAHTRLPSAPCGPHS